MKRLRILGVLFLILCSGAGAWFLFFQTYHFAVVQENVLYRDGMQGMRRFKNAYRFHPFKTVINLQSDDDLADKYKNQVVEEKQFCAEHGIKWFHIAMKQEMPPAPEQTAELLKITGDTANQPVFMHDSQGVIREGMMVAVWQIEKMGYDNERALREMNLWGHPANPELVEFIKQYKKSDAISRAAPTSK